MPEPAADRERIEAIAGMVLECLHREYPSHLSHALAGDHDARPPRELTPAFFGSYDWHSAVHGHWCLARLLRLHPRAGFVDRAAAAVDLSLTPDRLAAEVAYISVPGREGFERPYGLAWLLQLAAELREWGSPAALAWHQALGPLERLAAQRLSTWLERLAWPVRSGEHSQSAFALGLALDWARTAGDGALAARIVARSQAFYLADRDAPIGYEPSGQDFLSPILGEADLMRRVLETATFGSWLTAFLPGLASETAARWLTPVEAGERSDGKLAHLDGLNLSRGWMLDGVAAALPAGDPRRAVLTAAAGRHRAAGLESVLGEHYAGRHWLGSFAVYLLTGRGLAGDGVRAG